MGLDITAYRQLRELDVLFDEGGNPIDPQTRESIDDYFKVYANQDFPGREQGLKDRGIYAYAEVKHVFSRSYGGYNRWREILAKLAGYPADEFEMWGVREHSHAAAAWNGKVTEGPFYELVNFADNGGVIGPVVAAKLLHDFVEFDARASEITEHDFYEGYCEIRSGLELAADDGALHFN